MAYDYREPGPYFVTLCLDKRVHRFGGVTSSGILQASDAGDMAANAWLDIVRQFPTVELDTFIVMPDHLHAILTLDTRSDGEYSLTLSSVIDWYKSITVKRYGKGVREKGWPAYQKPLWQRSFYDHIVRNPVDLQRCQEYIEANPARWAEARGV